MLNSEKLRPKVLRSTSAVSATPSLSLTPKENPYPTPPQPTNPDTRTAPELTLGPATFTPAVSRNAKILLKGAVLLMDGLSFAVKENIAFMDCPLCRKPLALTILGDHLKSEHELKRLTCGATGCAQILESRDIMKHLYSKHGHLSCPDCGYNLYIHEVRDHIRSQCSRNFADSKRMPNPLNLTSVICSAPKLRPHEQKICPHCFMNVPDLKGHLLAEHDPKIKCDYCGKKVGRSVFQAHLNLDHGGSRLKRKKCPICLKLFGKLKVHLRAHHDMSKEDADSVYVSETKGGVLEVIVKRLSDPSYLELYNVKVVSGGDERPEDEDQSNSGSQFSPNSASLAESEDPSTEDEYEPMINDDDEEWNPNM